MDTEKSIELIEKIIAFRQKQRRQFLFYSLILLIGVLALTFASLSKIKKLQDEIELYNSVQNLPDTLYATVHDTLIITNYDTIVEYQQITSIDTLRISRLNNTINSLSNEVRNYQEVNEQGRIRLDELNTKYQNTLNEYNTFRDNSIAACEKSKQPLFTSLKEYELKLDSLGKQLSSCNESKQFFNTSLFQSKMKVDSLQKELASCRKKKWWQFIPIPNVNIDSPLQGGKKKN